MELSNFLEREMVSYPLPPHLSSSSGLTTAVLQWAKRNYDWSGVEGQTGKLIKQCYQHQILAHQSQLLES